MLRIFRQLSKTKLRGYGRVGAQVHVIQKWVVLKPIALCHIVLLRLELHPQDSNKTSRSATSTALAQRKIYTNSAMNKAYFNTQHPHFIPNFFHLHWYQSINFYFRYSFNINVSMLYWDLVKRNISLAKR